MKLQSATFFLSALAMLRYFAVTWFILRNHLNVPKPCSVGVKLTYYDSTWYGIVTEESKIVRCATLSRSMSVPAYKLLDLPAALEAHALAVKNVCTWSIKDNCTLLQDISLLEDKRGESRKVAKKSSFNATFWLIEQVEHTIYVQPTVPFTYRWRAFGKDSQEKHICLYL
jgi:hypothetical protein